MLEKDVGKILEATLASSTDARLKVIRFLFFFLFYGLIIVKAHYRFGSIVETNIVRT